MKNKIYGLKRATTKISNNAAKRLIPLGMYDFWGLELSNSGAYIPSAKPRPDWVFLRLASKSDT
jgi:hypothetical protein